MDHAKYFGNSIQNHNLYNLNQNKILCYKIRVIQKYFIIVQYKNVTILCGHMTFVQLYIVIGINSRIGFASSIEKIYIFADSNVFHKVSCRGGLAKLVVGRSPSEPNDNLGCLN